MNDRERLVNLIAAGGYHRELAELAADRILDDGWYRPLCKVGDTIYGVLYDTFPQKKWYVGPETVKKQAQEAAKRYMKEGRTYGQAEGE